MKSLKKNEIAKESGISTLKGLIGAIPFAGTLINEAIFEARGRLKQNRVNSFIENFASYIGKFKKEELKLEQINNDDFGDFFEELILRVSKTSSTEKRNAFKNILTNQFLESIEFDYSLLIVDAIDNLHIKQIPILKSLSSEKNSNYIEHMSSVITWTKEVKKKELELELMLFENEKGSGNDKEIVLFKRLIDSNKRHIKVFEKMAAESSKYYTSEFYNFTIEEYKYLIFDLFNKGLITDFSALYGASPFELIKISELGIDLIKHLEEH